MFDSIQPASSAQKLLESPISPSTTPGPIRNDQDNASICLSPVHGFGTHDHNSELNSPLVFDLQSFQNYLVLEEFRSAFRDWLALDPEFNHDGLLKLDRWMDEMKAESLVKGVREYSLSLFG